MFVFVLVFVPVVVHVKFKDQRCDITHQFAIKYQFRCGDIRGGRLAQGKEEEARRSSRKLCPTRIWFVGLNIFISNFKNYLAFAIKHVCLKFPNQIFVKD